MTFFHESINPTGSIPKPQVLPMFYQPLWCCTTSCIGLFMVCQLVLILQYIITYSWNLPDWDYLQKMHTITFLPRSWDGKFPLKYGVPRFPVSGKFIKLLRVSVVLTFIILTSRNTSRWSFMFWHNKNKLFSICCITFTLHEVEKLLANTAIYKFLQFETD